MQPANEDTVLGDFNNVSVKFHGVETRFFQEDNEFKLSTSGEGGEAAVFTVNYTFGHYPLQQYLIDIGKGRLQALNIAWDSRDIEEGGQRWYHLRANEKIDSENPFYWTRHFQNSNSRCIECHSSNVRKNYDPVELTYDTNWSEIGVGCEACHGPASRHVTLAESEQLSATNSGFDKAGQADITWTFQGDDNIASPSSSRNEDYLHSCGGCHSRRSSFADTEPLASYHDQYRLALIDQGLYFDDGQIDEEVFVMGSFLQSKMQRKGVTCSNCHNPHSGKVLVQGNALCAQCHKPEDFDTTAHHHHQTDSTGAQCVNCHMPQRLYMSVDLRRDHSFTIPGPRTSASYQTPNACTGCHQGRADAWAINAMTNWKTDEDQYLWAAINRGLERQDMLMFRNYASNPPDLDITTIRQATLTSKLAGFPSRLAVETAARKLADPDPLIRRAAASALRTAPVQLRWQYLSPLIDDPLKAIRLEVASALVDALPQLEGKEAEKLSRLIDEYRESLIYNADSPSGQLSIGNLEDRLGYSILAENAYLKALEIEPHFVPALINLSDFYRASGRDSESRKLLLHALQVAPESANTSHAYGLFLVRSGQQNEALEYFATATRQDDANPRHIYVYAVALDSLGQTGTAMKVIEEAGKRWPNNFELSFLQVSLMDKTGKTDGIHRYLSLLASVAANSPQVKAWMSKYGG